MKVKKTAEVPDLWDNVRHHFEIDGLYEAWILEENEGGIQLCIFSLSRETESTAPVYFKEFFTKGYNFVYIQMLEEICKLQKKQ